MDEYRRLVLKTAKNIHPDDQLLRTAISLCVNSGEFANLVNKMEFQNQELDREHLIRKVGDIIWWIEYAAMVLGVSIDEVKEINIAKLKLKNPEAFAEKTEEPIVDVVIPQTESEEDPE
jgi:NTP pyrophosphatase (non-canonical NTP hydrolase)